MAITNPYFHLRMFWGAFDVSYGTPEYSGVALQSGGASAAVGSGVGVRRAVLEFTQTAPGTIVDDKRVTHFDFLNLTGGAPDDTWIDSDYSKLEAQINAWFNGISDHVSQEAAWVTVKWYRVGTGLFPPNPAVRVTPVAGAGTSASTVLPPQVAMSITFKTARRPQWGRMYLPSLTTNSLGTHGSFSAAACDQIGAATDGLVKAAKGDDMHLGVLSKVAGSFFTVEQLQVDDVADVIRSRRWKNTTHRYESS
jgi:hypothetical protein